MSEAEEAVERQISESAARLVERLGLSNDEGERALHVRALIRAVGILVKVYGIDVESAIEQLREDVGRINLENVVEGAWRAPRSRAAQA